MDPQLANDATLSVVLSSQPAAFLMELPTTDDPSLEVALEVSLEEAAIRGEHLQGKAREGAPLTAEQLAIQLHVAELEAALQSAVDSRFARSLERAVDEDAQMIQFFQEIEQREREDRALALGMSQPGSKTSSSRYPEEVTESAGRAIHSELLVERRTEVAST